MTLLAMLIALMTAAGLAWRFCDPASRLYILDHPNERSLHTQPTPRSGGIAVLGGIAAGGMVLGYATYPENRELLVLFISALPIMMAAFWDDRFGVTPTVRLLVHFLAAAMLILAGFIPALTVLPGLTWNLPPFAAISVLLLFVVWMINLYNFMDGMDGFAGGMTVIGFMSFAILGWQADHTVFTGASLLIVGATLGFLVFNFPPAKIFLGDTGSSTLGFLAAAFSLWGSHDGLFPLWLAVFIFSPFVVDATVTLGRRLLHGEKIWRPHKTHYYQKLVQLGWGHRKTLLVETLIMLACSLSALLAMCLPSKAQGGFLMVWLLAYLLLMFGVHRLERRGAGTASL